jgi:NAD(P)-dependent dehydrogenase (short-subunit alcohol dehydrogenase family)
LELSSRRLEGKRVLVTGAASGIGLATARRLVAEGARVAISDVRQDGLDQACLALGPGAIATVCDVGDESSVATFVRSARDRLGGVDAVAHCAGIVRSGATHTLDLDEWETLLRVNLTGTFLVLKHSIPFLLEAGGGAIVTIGSVASVVAAGRITAYDASKGGVLQLTRAIAVEYSDRGLRANCILPGLVRTGLAANSVAIHGAMNLDTAAGPTARLRIPFERAAEPAEIGSVAAFLLSDDASFMTGAAVPVDGGYTAI